MRIPSQYYFVRFFQDTKDITCIDLSVVESVTVVNNEITIYLIDDDTITAYYKFEWMARWIARRIMKRKEAISNFNIMLNFRSLKYMPKKVYTDYNDDYEEA